MTINRNTYSVSDFIEINPKVSLTKGKCYSFVEMKDLEANRKYVLPSVIKELTGGARFQNKDTLFARITPCLENGKICQVKNLQNDLGFGSTEFLVFRGKKDISDTDFIYYLARTPLFRRFAESKMIGTSGRQRVAKEAFNNLTLTLPPLPEQRAIASILSVIDDKIELNLQMNKTLEEMAMTLYKHWFVDFGPFKDGEFYDVEFFGKNTLVQIPTNFEVCSVKNSIIRLKSNNKYDQTNVLAQGKVRVFDQSSSRILGYHNNVPDFISDFENPTLIFGDHTCRMEIVCEDFSVGPNLIPFRSKAQENTYVMYLGLKEKVNINDYKRHWSELMLHQIAIPKDRNIIIEFNSKIKENFSLITKNEFENETLTTLRDTLLPKLISGEVRVKEAEKALAEVL